MNENIKGLLVLQNQGEVEKAYGVLKARDLSCLSPQWLRWARRFKLTRAPFVGDRGKSWDLLNSVEFILRYLEKKDPILDIGAYGSEIIGVLHRLGFSCLTGVDLNPEVLRMPKGEGIRYAVGNFMHTSFANESFAAITAISVIEHGLNTAALLGEIKRLLRPGGYFLASVDYWPEKLDTTGIELFGMDWMIFSRQELEHFMRQAQTCQLFPVGTLNFDASERVIHFLDRDYTFAWMVLQKKMDG
ncbi:MAG: methyltransferase protein [Magnetococcales bacterium]|nr:methyltransferase protein [Magnetococcales bacterium]